MRCHTVKSLALLLAAIIGSLLCACSNSEGLDYANHAEEIAAVNEVSSSSDIPKVQEASSSSKELDYLPLDDSEYPYADIPRIVIETDNHREIKDRETEIPAKLQIWGENAPESEVMDLTIRGRGNSSWSMPKKSYKIEFIQKQEILGMPKDRDWALIANYADKTLMKNYVAYNLSTFLATFYTPRCTFIELYINNEYLGVYLLTETIKISKKRINIPKSDSSFVVEADEKYRQNEQIIFSNIITGDSTKKPFRIHHPQNATKESLSIIEKHIKNFELFLKQIPQSKKNNISQWIDEDDFLKYYWIQEFSKNPDASFYTSVYFIWEKNNVIKMGPVWDFDLAFGGYGNEYITNPTNWKQKYNYWYRLLLEDSTFYQKSTLFWIENKEKFYRILTTIDSAQTILKKAQKNNFKKWDILQSTSLPCHRKAYQTYEAAVNDLKQWINERLFWIESKISSHEQLQ